MRRYRTSGLTPESLQACFAPSAPAGDIGAGCLKRNGCDWRRKITNPTSCDDAELLSTGIFLKQTASEMVRMQADACGSQPPCIIPVLRSQGYVGEDLGQFLLHKCFDNSISQRQEDCLSRGATKEICCASQQNKKSQALRERNSSAPASAGSFFPLPVLPEYPFG